MSYEFAGNSPFFAEAEKPEQTTVSKTYETEIGAIEIKAKEFTPAPDIKDVKMDPSEGIILLGGYGGDPEFESAGWLSQSYADFGKQKVYAISSRTDLENQPNSLFYQAEAVVNFVKDNNLKKVIVVGYSEGAKKAMDVVKILQDTAPEIDTSQGLILLDPVGLYEQSRTGLSANFYIDALKTPASKKTAQAASDTMSGFGGEFLKSGVVKSVKRAYGDISQMAKPSTSAKEITCPVVIVVGKHDLVSNPTKIIPDAEAMNANREQELKDKYFKESPYVRMIVGEKDGHHGMPTYRNEEVAKTSLYMLERYNRKANPEQEVE